VNIFKGTPITYFQLPQELFETAKGRQLKPASLLLYVYLLHIAQMKSKEALNKSARRIEVG
jgi:hypothetical protein